MLWLKHACVMFGLLCVCVNEYWSYSSRSEDCRLIHWVAISVDIEPGSPHPQQGEDCPPFAAATHLWSHWSLPSPAPSSVFSVQTTAWTLDLCLLTGSLCYMLFDCVIFVKLCISDIFEIFLCSRQNGLLQEAAVFGWHSEQSSEASP